MPPRAPALKPEDRRRAIVLATLPLIREQGVGISTAEIARAAEVAEGTLFRVFENKAEILHAVIRHVMDPAESITELAAIDPGLDLRERMITVVRICHARIVEISLLMSALHASAHSHPPPVDAKQRHREHTTALLEAIAGVLAPDADRLTRPPMDVASLLRSLAFATSHPFLSDGIVTDPEVLVDVLLHGLEKGDR